MIQKNIAEHVEAMKEYEEICEKYEGIPRTINTDSGAWKNSEISPSISALAWYTASET